MIIGCSGNSQLKLQIEQFAEALKTQAHTIGGHGLSDEDFYSSPIFRGAIERIRGQFSAAMSEKRVFVQHVLNYLQDSSEIADWRSAGSSNRHDYLVTLLSGRSCAVELKGCLDGNNTNIFERPPNADEFVLWSVCTNTSSDPRRNVWSGIHTRLGAEIISKGQQVDGLIVWDMVCASVGRPCPKMLAGADLTEVGPYKLPPPCIYLFPRSIPHPRNNPNPPPNSLEQIEFLQALSRAFGGDAASSYNVELEVRYEGRDLQRRTRVTRGDEEAMASKWTSIRRS